MRQKSVYETRVYSVIENIELKNCAALADLGFTESDLEAWSDGMAVWYGSSNISVNNINIKSDATRSGRCGFVIEGYFPDGGKPTREIILSNANISGYDRPFHAELCGVSTILNSTFTYLSSNGHKFIKCSAVVWNVIETIVFNNCHFISDFSMLKTSGAKAVFNQCQLIKLTAVDNYFIAGPETTGEVTFNDSTLSQAGGAWNAWNSTFKFNNCVITSEVDSIINFGSDVVEKHITINNCIVNKSNINAGFATRFSRITVNNTQWVGSGIVVNAGDKADLIVSNISTVGSISAIASLNITGQIPTITTSPPNGAEFIINGEWIDNKKPVAGRPNGSGDWKVGDRIRNLYAGEGDVIGWSCVTAGAPGRWSSLGSLSGA